MVSFWPFDSRHQPLMSSSPLARFPVQPLDLHRRYSGVSQRAWFPSLHSLFSDTCRLSRDDSFLRHPLLLPPGINAVCVLIPGVRSPSAFTLVNSTEIVLFRSCFTPRPAHWLFTPPCHYIGAAPSIWHANSTIFVPFLGIKHPPLIQHIE